jgi:hypothetical protein
MSKSYRRPYASVTGNRSAKQDKILAHRGERRAQNFALRVCQDWEEFFLPHKRECHWNNVYAWSRDGRQRPCRRSRQYNNPFAYVVSPTWMTTEQIMERWEDSKQRDDEWMALMKRK